MTKGARERIEHQSLYAGRNDPTAVEDVVIRKVVYDNPLEFFNQSRNFDFTPPA